MMERPPLLSEVARKRALAVVELLEPPAGDIESVRDIAGNVTRAMDECKELFHRFQEEALAVEHLIDEPLSSEDLATAQIVLTRLCTELRSELSRS